MTKRFVILVDDATLIQQDKITAFLKGRFGWWHHFSDVWLATSQDEWTASKLRDELRKAVPDAALLVFQVDAGHRWAGTGPSKMFPWIKSTWQRKEPSADDST